MRRATLALLTIFCSFNVHADVRVMGIQLRISPAMYSSVDAFAAAIEERLSDEFTDPLARETPPELLVFPEYTSVFLALIPYYEQIRNSETISEALDRIKEFDPRVSSVYDLFSVNSRRVEAVMDLVWGTLARKYGVALVAGTRFVAGPGGLVNSSVIYGPDGMRFYEQNKVYLTEFETDIVGLTPGRVRAADTFEINGHSIALTICRDTFFPAWNERFVDVEYWIDIKANGTEFDREEEDRFLTALPVRVLQSDATGGMTVCLTGTFLDLFWEGRSFTVYKDSWGVHVGQVAETQSGPAVIRD